MNISSHRMASSRYRDTINLASSGITKRERHLWVCSQIHSRAVFFIVQVLMILLSLTILVQSVTKSLSDRLDWGHIFIAYALFLGLAVSGIWALKLVDNEHKKGSRIKKHGVIPPKFIIIPSYIVQFTLFAERHPFESSSSRNRNCHLAMNTLHERERIKPAENFIGSKEVCNNTETKIEIMPPIHAADNMTPCFSECPRRGISIITSQLDTVPEESSKSTNSLE
ncbi:hypothetical protein WUBG_02645 [Wuchereria bancrofti]|uniref:Transmembrane protein n=1 Tax=Wuchereria bancrofti TaxID=6293 RepID=J9EV11_WUCBA|nr:hypothetical protein WUBG_02645 [Wuchereria bancrofti]